MYSMQMGGVVRQVSTLSQVLGILTDYKLRETHAAAETSIVGPQGPLRLAHRAGKVGVFLPGEPVQVLSALLQSAWADASMTHPQPQPWHMSRAQWLGLQALRDLASGNLPGIDSEQRRNPVDYVDWQGQATSGPLVYWFESEFRRVFGYHSYGPAYDGLNVNERHELHVAYALARNEPVPEFVLEDYSDFGMDLSWASTLVRCPTLRGRLTIDQLRCLDVVLERREKRPIEPRQVEQLVAIASRTPPNATVVEMDDALFEAGLVTELPVPAEPEADLTGVSPFALAVRDEIIRRTQRQQCERMTSDRQRGLITRRECLRQEAMRKQEWKTHSATYGVRLEEAIQNKDIDKLLSILDTADDHNRGSKRAVEGHYRCKLLDVPAQARRASVYRLCGMNAEQQAEHEVDLQRRRELRERQRALDDLIEQVSAARYRLDDHSVVSGREYVDLVIDQMGAREIVEYKKGAAKVYYLRVGATSLRPLKAGDGTLAYARHRLQALATSQQVGTPCAETA